MKEENREQEEDGERKIGQREEDQRTERRRGNRTEKKNGGEKGFEGSDVSNVSLCP